MRNHRADDERNPKRFGHFNMKAAPPCEFAVRERVSRSPLSLPPPTALSSFSLSPFLLLLPPVVTPLSKPSHNHNTRWPEEDGLAGERERE